MNSFTVTLQTGPIQIERMSGCILLLHVPCFIKNPIANANNEDPDQTPRSVASDLGLHRLPGDLNGVMSFYLQNHKNINA